MGSEVPRSPHQPWPRRECPGGEPGFPPPLPRVHALPQGMCSAKVEFHRRVPHGIAPGML